MYTVPSVYFSCFLPTKAWSWTTLFCDWQPCPHTVWQDALCVQSAGNGILARSFIWICRTSSFARISVWTCGIKQSRTNNFNYLNYLNHRLKSKCTFSSGNIPKFKWFVSLGLPFLTCLNCRTPGTSGSWCYMWSVRREGAEWCSKATHRSPTNNNKLDQNTNSFQWQFAYIHRSCHMFWLVM